MRFPAIAEVEQADLEQLARWWRFLPPSNEIDSKYHERKKEEL